MEEGASWGAGCIMGGRVHRCVTVRHRERGVQGVSGASRVCHAGAGCVMGDRAHRVNHLGIQLIQRLRF